MVKYVNIKDEKILLKRDCFKSDPLTYHLLVCCALPCDCCHKIVFFFRYNNIKRRFRGSDFRVVEMYLSWRVVKLS